MFPETVTDFSWPADWKGKVVLGFYIQKIPHMHKSYPIFAGQEIPNLWNRYYDRISCWGDFVPVSALPQFGEPVKGRRDSAITCLHEQDGVRVFHLPSNQGSNTRWCLFMLGPSNELLDWADESGAEYDLGEPLVVEEAGSFQISLVPCSDPEEE